MRLDQTGEVDRSRVELGLKKAISMLTPTQRTYLNLYYFEGYTMLSIGQKYGVDKSTVSRTLKRGRTNLYKYLQFTSERFLREGMK